MFRETYISYASFLRAFPLLRCDMSDWLRGIADSHQSLHWRQGAKDLHRLPAIVHMAPGESQKVW